MDALECAILQGSIGIATEKICGMKNPKQQSAAILLGLKALEDMDIKLRQDRLRKKLEARRAAQK